MKENKPPFHLVFRNKIKESSLFYRFLPAKVPWKPMGVSIAVTTNCNLKCSMCERTVNIDRLKIMNMNVETYKKIIKNIKNKEISLCGLGETLCHPHIFEFIRLANENNNKVHFTTNANLLTEEVSKELLKYDIEAIVLSIDGIGDTYNRIRNGGDFDTVINNIKRFTELRKEAGKEKPVFYASFVGMKSNIEEFPKLIKILEPYVYTFGLLHPIIFSQEIINEHLNKNVDLASSVFEKIEESKMKIMLRQLSPSPRGCLEPWVKPFIGVDGNVYPCCMIGGNSGLDSVDEFYDDVKITLKMKDYVMGNIMEEDLGKIWNNKKFVEFRKRLKKIIVNDARKDWNEEKYIQMLKDKGESIFFCEFCPYRWNCGA